MRRPRTVRAPGPSGAATRARFSPRGAGTGRTDVSDRDPLINDLVHRSWPQGRHTGDIALLPLRTTGRTGSTSGTAAARPAPPPDSRDPSMPGAGRRSLCAARYIPLEKSVGTGGGVGT